MALPEDFFFNYYFLLLLVCCISFCFCKTFISKSFELPVSHVAAMGSGSPELWEPSMQFCAPVTSHDKGWVTQLSADILAAVPRVVNHDVSPVSPPCATGYRVYTLTLMKSALVLSLHELSEITVANCNEIIYAKPKLQNTDLWTVSHLHEMSAPEGKTVLRMQQAMS